MIFYPEKEKMRARRGFVSVPLPEAILPENRRSCPKKMPPGKGQEDVTPRRLVIHYFFQPLSKATFPKAAVDLCRGGFSTDEK
jgi:hypothetical protein